MTKLHQVVMPDNGKADGKTDPKDLVCTHCGKHLEPGDAFITSTDDPLYVGDGYFDRAGFETCTKNG